MYKYVSVKISPVQEMADNKEKVTAFRNLMRDNRKIVLEHNGRRYKAKSVIQVMYSSRNDVPSSGRKCGTGMWRRRTSIHVVMVTGEVCFVVEVWEGCACHYAEVGVLSVEEKPHLKALLEASPYGYEYKEILAELFPPEQTRQVRSSSSSSSSDSY